MMLTSNIKKNTAALQLQLFEIGDISITLNNFITYMMSLVNYLFKFKISL